MTDAGIIGRGSVVQVNNVHLVYATFPVGMSQGEDIQYDLTVAPGCFETILGVMNWVATD